MKTTSRNLLSIVIYLVLIINIASSFLPEPPEILRHLKRDRLYAKKGEDIKLVCPVRRRSKSDPFIDWIKEDEIISTQSFRRYKLSRNFLLIRNITLSDSGVFKCRATNGFGQKTIHTRLVVTDETLDDFYADEIKDEEETKEETVESWQIPSGQAKPSFNQITKNHRQVIQRPAGSSARLKCLPSGNPLPTVVWLKSNKQLYERDLNSKSKIRRNTLHLVNLRSQDSGKYTCKLTNKWGSINTSFSIEVIEKITSKPTLIGPQPVNNTVEEGGTASFLCQIRSESIPHVRWLKEVIPNSEDKDLINRNGKFYKVLQETKMLLREDGVYLNKLIIQNVSPDDAGNYVCFGANNMGFSKSFAHLNVNIYKISGPIDHVLTQEKKMAINGETIEKSKETITILVVVAVLVVIVVVMVTVKCMRSRSRPVHVANKRYSENVIVSAKSSHSMPYDRQIHTDSSISSYVGKSGKTHFLLPNSYIPNHCNRSVVMMHQNS